MNLITSTLPITLPTFPEATTLAHLPISDTLDYRGYHIHFELEPGGAQMTAEWQGAKLDFGLDNIDYKNDMRHIIDDFEDTLVELHDGAKLVRFQNGPVQDVKLVYNGRIIKVYLLTNPGVTNDELRQKLPSGEYNTTMALLVSLSNKALDCLEPQD